MTLPANDAFTLGFPHDTARIGLRSSSKIPFVSSPNARSPPPPARKRDSQPRQMSADLHLAHLSNGAAPAALSNGVPASNGAPLRHRKKARTTTPPPSSRLPDRPRPPQKQRQPVDWEIPRKALHSSIGFLTLYLYATNRNPRTVVQALGLALLIVVPADIIRLNSTRFEWLFERCVGFLMRESERKSTNGVIWYIVGVIFVLSVYPLDIATVSILILSWADTAASTIGRLWGAYTPPLPHSLPLIPFLPFPRLPLAPRKSLAGFLAGSITGAAIAVGFWGFFYPTRDAQLAFHLPSQEATHLVADHLPPAAKDLVTHGAQRACEWLGGVVGDLPVGRWLGLTTLAAVSGMISGTAEALDLGSLDDNLTLPIISGGCIWAFFKALEYLSGPHSA